MPRYDANVNIMRRWYVTLKVDMAIDSNMEKEELEEILNTANNIDVNIVDVDTYNPDMVEALYLEPSDA